MNNPHHTIIIAEAGVNHNGDLDMAYRLIDAAAEAGVDFVKFQTFKTEKLVSPDAATADYQKQSVGESSQYKMLKKLELSAEQHYKLMEYCARREVKFLSTAFDFDSIDFLASLNLPMWKIPSGEVTNYPYLERIAHLGKPVVMSTGMCEMSDVDMAVKILTDNGVSREDITLLHCNTQYPTPFNDVNLNAMVTMKHHTGMRVGYSDHTLGIEVPIAAVALGAEVIEKHFTLDRTLPGPDHKASLEPKELKAMIESIRNIELALGDGAKHITDSERQNISAARKSIVAACDIPCGEIFTEKNLDVKRPSGGLSPMLWPQVLGKVAVRDFKKDEFIEIP